MLAVRLRAVGEPPRLEERPDPAPAGREVVVRVAACGVCRTDLHIVEGRQPRVELPVTLGHEIAGHLEAWGPDAVDDLRAAGLRRGAPVVVFGGWGCGTCRECAVGAEQRCAESAAPGFQRDGGWAERVLVPDPRHLVPLGRLDPVLAAPLADAGVTPFRAVRRAAPWLEPGAHVLVNGCGALGQFALQHLRATPAGDELRLIARDVEPSRLERAAALGADVGILAGGTRAVRRAVGGPADVVLDFVGDDASLEMASLVVAPDGLVMLVGEAGGRLAFGFEAPPVESWLTTTAWGTLDDLRTVVDRARRRRLHWDVERMPLADAERALARLRDNAADDRIVLVP